MLNCTIGTIDDSNFSKPMPLIGLYIAGATLVCIILMVMDLLKGFMTKQLWMPARYFSIHAASLTVIGVAIKLSVDLNSPLPSQTDQLAKLATSAFICTLLVNIQPSLGRLGKGELLENTIALAILITTSIVNLCIQLRTGVIHAFRNAHIFVIVMMSYLLLTCLRAAASVPVIKNHSLLNFEKLHQHVLKEMFSDSNEKESKKMEYYLRRYSMLALSSCPHFLLSRSSAYMAVVAHGLLPASALFFVLFASITHRGKTVGLNTCSGESDYGWSVRLILVTQAIAVVIGLVSPLGRMVYVITAKIFGPEKERPEQLELKRLHCCRTLGQVLSLIAYLVKEAPRVLLLIMFFPVPVIEIDKQISRSVFKQMSDDELIHYFLHSKSEKRSFRFMAESSSLVIQNYIDVETPKNLIDFLQKYLSPDFEGVLSFSNDKIAKSRGFHKAAPNCWALPVVTLISIASALPNIDRTSKVLLRMSVTEGLVYVKLVEDKLNNVHDLHHTRAAADRVWSAFHGKCKWFGVDLEDLALNGTPPTGVLSALAKAAEKGGRKDKYNFRSRLKRNILRLSESTERDVAARSMYTISQTMLHDYQIENNPEPSSNDIFEKLCNTIADILGACFTNLRQCILLECKSSAIEKRRETALRMLKLFGETQKIMEILEGKTVPDLPDDKLAFLDGWRSHLATSHRS